MGHKKLLLSILLMLFLVVGCSPKLEAGVGGTAVVEPTDRPADDGWQTIDSEFVSFRLPGEWQPAAVEPGLGTVLAEWQLGIPGVDGDQVIGFSAVSFDILKPADVVRTDAISLGGIAGEKWLRSGEGYVSYDYYGPPTDEAEQAGAGNFGLHVTVAEADPDLEAVLDSIVASVVFAK